jgi:hypothetical protein
LFAGIIRRILLNKSQLTSIELRSDTRLLKDVLTIIIASTFEILDHILQLLYLQFYVCSFGYLVQVTACGYVTPVQTPTLLPVNHLNEKAFYLFHSTVVHFSNFHLLVFKHFVLICLTQDLLLLRFKKLFKLRNPLVQFKLFDKRLNWLLLTLFEFLNSHLDLAILRQFLQDF